MNHNPLSAIEPADPGIVALLPGPVKPKALGPWVARIRAPGRDQIESRGLPNSDAALEWAYGYLGLRASTASIIPQFPNGTTVHIGSRIFVLYNKTLRPIGMRRVLAVPAAKAGA